MLALLPEPLVLVLVPEPLVLVLPREPLAVVLPPEPLVVVLLPEPLVPVPEAFSGNTASPLSSTRTAVAVAETGLRSPALNDQ